MISGIRIAGTALIKVAPIVLGLNLVPFGYFQRYACLNEIMIRMPPMRMPGTKPDLNRRLTLYSAMTA